jgi:hypothetical protein
LERRQSKRQGLNHAVAQGQPQWFLRRCGRYGYKGEHNRHEKGQKSGHNVAYTHWIARNFNGEFFGARITAKNRDWDLAYFIVGASLLDRPSK